MNDALYSSKIALKSSRYYVALGRNKTQRDVYSVNLIVLIVLLKNERTK